MHYNVGSSQSFVLRYNLQDITVQSRRRVLSKIASHRVALGSILPCWAPGSWRTRCSWKTSVSLLPLVSFYSLKKQRSRAIDKRAGAEDKSKRSFKGKDYSGKSEEIHQTNSPCVLEDLLLRGHPPLRLPPERGGNDAWEIMEEITNFWRIIIIQFHYLLANNTRRSYHPQPTSRTLNKTEDITAFRQNSKQVYDKTRMHEYYCETYLSSNGSLRARGALLTRWTLKPGERQNRLLTCKEKCDINLGRILKRDISSPLIPHVRSRPSLLAGRAFPEKTHGLED